MNKIKAKGMHCKSCESLIGSKLDKIEGLGEYSVSSEKGEILFEGGDELMAEVEKAISDSGFEIVKDDDK